MAYNTDERIINLASKNVEGISFDTTATPPHTEGQLHWNNDDKALEVDSEVNGVSLQIGQENWIRATNKTGVQIDNGSIVYIDGVQGQRPTIALADASDPDKANKVIGMVTHDILNNATGYVTTFGLVRDLDTSLYPEGTQLYLSDTTPGGYTSTQTLNNTVKIGVVTVQNATTGIISFHPEKLSYFNNTTTNLMNFWNGSFQESFDARTSSDGVTVTMSLEKSGTGDLTMRFSDGYTTLDCTPAQTIALTVGTDIAPQSNFIYIPQSTKVLTKSTTGFPTTEHIKIGYFFVPSATKVQSDSGVLVNQNWNDERADNNNIGHQQHITEKIRYALGPTYRSGLDLSVTISGSPSNVYLALTSGIILQVHRQTIPAIDMQLGADAHVINDPTTAYKEITNLNSITVDANNNTINNKYFNLFVALAANKTGEYQPILINLPTGSYINLADAINDVDNYNVTSLPDAFSKYSSTGLALYILTFRKVGGTTWTLENTKDIRGQNGISGGASITPQNDFSDGTFTLFNSSDPTKIVDFNLSGLTSATTRTLTIQDADGTLDYTHSNRANLDVIDQDLATTDDVIFRTVTIQGSTGVPAPSLVSGDNSLTVQDIKSTTAFSTSNQSGINMILNTTTQARNVTRIVGSLTDTTDATRTSKLSFYNLVSGSFDERVTFLGRDLGVGTTSPSATIHADQTETDGAKPVLYLDQADVSEEMIQFETTIGTGNAIEAVGAKTLTTTHFIKVTLPGGLTRYIPAGTIA